MSSFKFVYARDTSCGTTSLHSRSGFQHDWMMTLPTTRTGAMSPIGPKRFETSLSKDRFVMFETYSHAYKK